MGKGRVLGALLAIATSACTDAESLVQAGIDVLEVLHVRAGLVAIADPEGAAVGEEALATTTKVRADLLASGCATERTTALGVETDLNGCSGPYGLKGVTGTLVFGNGEIRAKGVAANGFVLGFEGPAFEEDGDALIDARSPHGTAIEIPFMFGISPRIEADGCTTQLGSLGLFDMILFVDGEEWSGMGQDVDPTARFRRCGAGCPGLWTVLFATGSEDVTLVFDGTDEVLWRVDGENGSTRLSCAPVEPE